jgi:hypothetical protein
VPLVDLRLTTIEPVDIRGAIYADEQQRRRSGFRPSSCPARAAGGHPVPRRAHRRRSAPADLGLLADPRPRVGNYRLPDGWQVIAAGNAAFHGAVSHDMGTALADRMFHFNVQSVIDAFLDYALATTSRPRSWPTSRCARTSSTIPHSQLANDHLVGASPRGWEDISNVLKSDLSDAAKRVFVQGRIGAANAAEFFGVLREIQAGTDVLAAARCRARRGDRRAAADQPRRALRHALRAARGGHRRAAHGRALAILDQLPDVRAEEPLPIREVQTLAWSCCSRRRWSAAWRARCSPARPICATPRRARRRSGLGSADKSALLWCCGAQVSRTRGCLVLIGVWCRDRYRYRYRDRYR